MQEPEHNATNEADTFGARWDKVVNFINYNSEIDVRKQCCVYFNPGSIMTIPVVDAHAHLWNPERLHYPWLKDVPELQKIFGLEYYQQASETIPIEKMVFVDYGASNQVCSGNRSACSLEYSGSIQQSNHS